MYKIIDEYIDYLIENSTPEVPLWNIERFRSGKENRWNYIDGTFMTSLLYLYDETENEKYLNFVKSYVNHFVQEDGTINGYEPTHYSTDDLSSSRILFDMLKLDPNEKIKGAIEYSYNQILNHPRISTGNFWHKQIYHDQVWLDGLYMMQPFYARYVNYKDLPELKDDIINQFLNVRKLMFDEDKKLYYHCYDESKTLFWANKETGLSPHFWLRAIGWYLVGLADVYELLEDNKKAEPLKELLKEAIDGLLQYQDQETKMFYQIVDLGSREPNYLETSGSLLTSFAILKGVRLGMLPHEYQQIGRDIFDGVVKNRLTVVDGNLNLGGICLVAGLGPESRPERDGTFEYYMSEPIVENDAKGTGPLIMAYSEVKKLK